MRRPHRHRDSPECLLSRQVVQRSPRMARRWENRHPWAPKSRSDVESGDGEAEAGSSLSRSPEAGHLGD